MGTLSVRENITFSAALRLPSRYSSADRKERVWQVMEELGLTEVADSKVNCLKKVYAVINLLTRLERSLSGVFLGEKRNVLVLEWS